MCFVEETVMENIDENIQSIADIHLKICDFSNFCANVHNSVGCQKPGCRFKIYCDILSNYLKRVDRNNDEKRLFFISHCKFFELVFFCAYKLYLLDKMSL